MSGTADIAAAADESQSPIRSPRRDTFVRSDGTRAGALGVREGMVRAASDESLARRRTSSPKSQQKSWRNTLTRRRPTEAEPLCCVKYSSKGLSTCPECGKSW